MHVATPTLFLWLIALASILCMLLRPRGIAEAWWVSGGALLLVAARLVPLAQAGKAVLAGTDVYLFLTGMMLLAELAREEGVFDWIADLAARHAHGSPRRLFLLVYLAGTLVTAVLSNDATAVVLTPAVLAVVRRARVAPTPHLLLCALIANAASFLLPISNPANLVLFGTHMPTLAAWLRMFLLPSIASIVLTFVVLRTLSHTDLQGRIADTGAPIRLTREGKLTLAGLALAVVTLIASSALGWRLGAPTCAAAAIAMLLVGLVRRDRHTPLQVLRSVSWSVLPLVAGLFILVEALQNAGMLHLVQTGLDACAHSSRLGGHLAAAFAAALLSNGMNNLPVGLIGGAAVRSAHVAQGLANAVLIGVDLGPNLSVTGSLATILWLIALRREGVAITAWQFLKVGVIAMPLALLGSILLLR